MVWHRMLLFSLIVIAVELGSIIEPQPVAAASARVLPSAPLEGAQAQTIDKFATSEKVVCLTLDAGSDAGYAAFILDTLREKDVRVSFGMTGQWAAANPQLVRRMAAEGHALINHTDSHRSLTGRSTRRTALTFDERVHEIRAAEERIWHLSGADVKPYFRPPYGDTDTSVARDLSTLGYRYNIMWTSGLDTLGWKGRSKEQIIQTVLANVSPGAIVLMHVGSESQDGPALPELIDQLRNQGYSFRTIADMLPQIREFPETNRRLRGMFRTYWERTGGLAVYGYPISGELRERNPDTGKMATVQYFERQRFELQPHNAPPYHMLLGRLGAADAQRRGLLRRKEFQRLRRQTNAACTFFSETGHHLCGAFRDYWQAHGLDFADAGVSSRESLALFGLPISEEFRMRLADGHWHKVQYFERARFEWHPENSRPFDILLGRLGAEQPR